MECSTSAGPYFTTHGVKVSFFIPDYSSSKIILYRFYVDKNEGELVIGYDMIIGRGLMLKLGISSDFKHQVL